MSLRASVVLVLCFFSASCFAESAKSKTLVNDAWKAWQKNDHELVRESFLNAIKEDPQNTHAYWGLTLLYSLESNYKESWNTFKKAAEIEPDFYPYVYSFLYTQSFYGKELVNPEIVDMLKKLTEKPDKNGILRAMADERLGKYYISKGDFAQSEKYFSDINSIDQWMLIGPFENISASGYDKVYPPETEFAPEKTYPGRNEIPAKWFKLPMARRDRWVDFTRFYAQRNSVFYGNTFVYSPKKQTVQIRIGTSGFLRAFRNDQLIIDVFEERNNDLDNYIVEVELQEGWNRLLLKCGYAEISACNFLARITDAQGNKIEGIRYSPEKQAYSKTNSPAVKEIGNFAEEFFRNKIKSSPEVPENYLLLAETYLRNDKAVEAELILKDAIKLFPDCMLFYHKIAEAYQRGKKNDEVETTYEKVFSADKNIPEVLQYKGAIYVKNEEYDKAEEILNILNKIAPMSQHSFEVAFGIAGQKKQVDRIFELNRLARENFPYEYQYAYLDAIIKYQQSKRNEDAIKLFQDFLKGNYNDNALYTLAQYYLQASDVANWEKCMDALIEYEPASPGFYFNKATIYFSMQQYDKAEKEMNRALALCGNSAQYWNKLGEICRMKGDKGRAVEMYNNGLKYDPTDYEAREIIRELQGKKSLYKQFEQADIKSLVQNAPSHEAYPSDDAILLLDDMKRLVYKKGASESTEEILIKLFNKKGIDNFKEYNIGYNSNQQLIIEKAVVIKKDGSEVNADIEDNQIVFKSLEENDCIYIKHRLKNVYAGVLSKYYWDSFNFNGFYPIKNISYRLFLEDESGFKYNTQNMSAKPRINKTEDGTFYTWTLKDEPAIEAEYGMPELNDIGEVLSISNMPDWKVLVDWYSDITKNKVRSNYEIKEQVARLFDGRTGLTDEEKIRTIYDFITENIRYSSVSFRQSDLIPQRARDVLASRIGDCKDMATLCKAMLNEAGISSHYVLLNTIDNGRNGDVLPSLLFNHCILAVETKNGEKFIDLTANNVPVNSLPALDIDAFYLIIKSGVTAPARIPKNSSQKNISLRQSVVNIKPDGILSIKSLVKKTGLLAAAYRDQYRYIDSTEGKKNITETVSKRFPNFKFVDFSCNNLNNFESPVEYSFAFEVPNFINETGSFTILKMPWTDVMEPDYGFSYENRQFPYNRYSALDSLSEEMDIVLPGEYEPLEPNQSVSHSSSFADYTISITFENGVIHAKKSFVFKEPVITTEDYSKCKDFYNKVLKEDQRQILLKRKG